MTINRLSLLAAFLLGVLAGFATASATDNVGHVGNPLPPVELDGLAHTPAKSFEDFLGRTVLIEYFGIFGDTGVWPIPRLNKLQEKFGSQGLSIVSITDWNKQLVEQWMAGKDVNYAYAYDKGAKFKRLMGITAYPVLVLVDPSGTIVWEGDIGALGDSVVEGPLAKEIEKTLPGSLTKPVWEWTAAARPTRLLLAKHKYADAIGEAAKLSDADFGPTIKAQIQALVASRVKSMKAAFDAKKFLQAEEAAEALAKDLEGLPEVAEAKKTLDAIKNDKDAERVIKGQKKIREIGRSNLSSKKDIEKAIAEVEKIIKDHSGTAAEEEGKVLLEQLNVKKDPSIPH